MAHDTAPPSEALKSIPIGKRTKRTHGLVKATIIPEIVKLIAEKYTVPEKKALDMFYTSTTAASLADDETGLYGQSALYIFSLFVGEQNMTKDLFTETE